MWPQKSLADTVHLDGPIVLVEARPATNAFLADGRSFDFYDGMKRIANRTSGALAKLPSRDVQRNGNAQSDGLRISRRGALDELAAGIACANIRSRFV